LDIATTIQDAVNEDGLPNHLVDRSIRFEMDFTEIANANTIQLWRNVTTGREFSKTQA
jgi:hypothetical protein